jgi:leucyl aminopeptidase
MAHPHSKASRVNFPFFSTDRTSPAVPVWPVRAGDLESWLSGQPPERAAWARAAGFRAEAGRVLPLPDGAGAVAGFLFGLGGEDDPFPYAALSGALPPGRYRIDAALTPDQNARAALGFALGTYSFGRYRPAKPNEGAVLVLPEDVDAGEAERAVEATFLVRDLVNTPANDLGPEELVQAGLDLARRYGAKADVTRGDALASGFPLVHAVGRASARPPLFLDMTWGDEGAPKVTLVGKGVCFDSGGLDIKPSSGMALMKKDMGGAAHVFGLAHRVMGAGLPLRLRVLVPAVENSVSGTAFRPGDVLRSRKGLTVEIGNTDAEGRLILADALALACEEQPDLLVDFATLTGAARVALGPDLPPLYTDDDALAGDLARHAAAQADPLWRMPLWPPYNADFESKLADLNNSGTSSFAGSITAALFLKRFVADSTRWAHLDIYAWNAKARPGRPVGGEAQTIRAWYALLRERYAR